MFILDDTIAALASAAGPGGRGIIRCSGPQVVDVLNHKFCPDDRSTWLSSRIARRHPGTWRLAVPSRFNPESNGVPPTLDLRVDVHLWPNSRSYTGQRQAELHTLGSPPLLEALLSDLFASGARPAQPGEFTLRAFLAGRMDLMQAEAVLGVIDAANSSGLQVALAQLAGGVSQRITELRTGLIDLLADLEAGLDFTEEGIEFVDRDVLVARLHATHRELQGVLNRAINQTRTHTRPRVVLAGPPNAGKSTLFNALAGESKALVSPVPGTTRDYLMSTVDWHGSSWDLVDTAGTDESQDPILNAAMELRSTQLQQADLILNCQPAVEIEPGVLAWSQAISHHDGNFSTHGQRPDSKTIQVITKCDLCPHLEGAISPTAIAVSVASGLGLDDLRSRIILALAKSAGTDAGILGSTLARCRDSLDCAVAALERASELAATGGGDEFLATDVREALDELGRITGAFYTDDLLDRIFSKFCIGK